MINSYKTHKAFFSSNSLTQLAFCLFESLAVTNNNQIKTHNKHIYLYNYEALKHISHCRIVFVWHSSHRYTIRTSLSLSHSIYDWVFNFVALHMMAEAEPHILTYIYTYECTMFHFHCLRTAFIFSRKIKYFACFAQRRYFSHSHIIFEAICNNKNVIFYLSFTLRDDINHITNVSTFTIYTAYTAYTYSTHFRLCVVYFICTTSSFVSFKKCFFFFASYIVDNTKYDSRHS